MANSKNYTGRRFHNYKTFEDNLVEAIDKRAEKHNAVTEIFKKIHRRRVYIDNNKVRKVVINS
jgi:hypothetical protein